MLLALFSLGGCVSNRSYMQVAPGEAESVLRVGDAVEITRKDQSVVYLKLKEINSAKVVGSDQTSMFGHVTVAVPLDEVTSIRRSKKEGYDAEQTIEAWSHLLILWPFFVL